MKKHIRREKKTYKLFFVLYTLCKPISGLVANGKIIDPELLGKEISVLIPQIFVKQHKEIISKKVQEFKKLMLSLGDTRLYKPTFKEIEVYGLTKLKYLTKIHSKITKFVL